MLRRDKRHAPWGADGKTSTTMRNRSAPEKLELAARLRRETTLTMREIAQRLYLVSWKSATTRLQSLKQNREQQSAQVIVIV